MASVEPLPSGEFQGIYYDLAGNKAQVGPFTNRAIALRTAQTAEKQAQRDPAKAKWADWFQLALNERGWSQADFVRASENFIPPDRASKWLTAKVMPSYRLAIAAADAFGLPHTEALVAAGFSPDAASTAVPDPLTVLAIENRVHQEKLAAFTNAHLLAELLRRTQDNPVFYIGTELAEFHENKSAATRQEGTN